MAYTIASNICEGVAACPVACIEQGKGANVKGTIWFRIDAAICIDCGVCLQGCPIQGACDVYTKAEDSIVLASAFVNK